MRDNKKFLFLKLYQDKHQKDVKDTSLLSNLDSAGFKRPHSHKQDNGDKEDKSNDREQTKRYRML